MVGVHRILIQSYIEDKILGSLTRQHFAKKVSKHRFWYFLYVLLISVWHSIFNLSFILISRYENTVPIVVSLNFYALKSTEFIFTKQTGTEFVGTELSLHQKCWHRTVAAPKVLAPNWLAPTWRCTEMAAPKRQHRKDVDPSPANAHVR